MYCNRRSRKREWEFAGTSLREVSLTVGNDAAEEVDSFKYLGANVTTDGGSTADIRVTMAGTSFRRLENTWMAISIGINTVVSIFKSLILSVLVYGCETWKLTKIEKKRIDTFKTKCPREILKNRWQEHFPNKAVLEMAVKENISCGVRRRRWDWIGHVLRKDPMDDCVVSFEWTPEVRKEKGPIKKDTAADDGG